MIARLAIAEALFKERRVSHSAERAHGGLRITAVSLPTFDRSHIALLLIMRGSGTQAPPRSLCLY
jgi:hypothetical protein